MTPNPSPDPDPELHPHPHPHPHLSPISLTLTSRPQPQPRPQPHPHPKLLDGHMCGACACTHIHACRCIARLLDGRLSQAMASWAHVVYVEHQRPGVEASAARIARRLRRRHLWLGWSTWSEVAVSSARAPILARTYLYMHACIHMECGISVGLQQLGCARPAAEACLHVYSRVYMHIYTGEGGLHVHDGVYMYVWGTVPARDTHRAGTPTCTRTYIMHTHMHTHVHDTYAHAHART